MAETIPELYRQLVAAADGSMVTMRAGDVETARERMRETLSVASRLLPRLAALVELKREGVWAAEVDRAIKRAEELPGQLAIDDALPKSPKRGGRRKA